METEFRMFPRQASSIAAQIDILYAFLVVVSVIFTVGICAAIVYFMIRYNATNKTVNRKNPLTTSLVVEAVWMGVPLILTMVMFFWGAVLYSESREPPDDATEITVVGKQWMWKLQHPAGEAEINTLHVPVGRPVKLKMVSEDVIHSFSIPDFRVKMDVLPDRYTYLWFTPTETGRFRLYCTEYCGTDHSGMGGWVVVQTPAEHAEWLSGESGASPIELGRQLFERAGCMNCHQNQESNRAPSLVGIVGRNVKLKDGQTVVADVDYLRESIRDPQKKIVAGFPTVMPKFTPGQLSEQDILHLIAYIKSLSPDSPPPEPATPENPQPHPQPEENQE